MAQLSASGEAVILDRHDDGLPRIRRGAGLARNGVPS